ncbi:MAG: glycoside hydrolase family protein [Bacteroidaceae bacterium]|nr:glycoside hydrolase family protein [Bacteroidaceae bacterium]
MLSKKIVTFAQVLLLCLGMNAQIEERPRPAEWEKLVPGGRYMDRFDTMPGEQLVAAHWGAEAVRTRLVDNGLEVEDMSIWGGNILQGADGTYHMFVCGWPEHSRGGHSFWKHSTVFHATSHHLGGPYRIQESIGKGHNPEAYLLPNGHVVVYTIDGYYESTKAILTDDATPNMWVFGQYQFDARGHRIIEGLSNLTFCRRSDSSYLMVCRGGGVWISEHGLGKWSQLTSERIYPPVKGEFEDPVVWRDSIQYHLIVNDWLGRIAWYERSLDGLHWIVEPGEAYTHGFSRHADGAVEPWFKYERPKVFQDEYGRVIQMNFAVIDTLKAEDKPHDTHSSKNICISMNKGLLLEVLNTEPIDERTRKIELRIKGEADFHPADEVDVKSLLFGSYKEVNYGRGCRAVKTRVEGNDLVVTFNGKGSGIDADEWAPKLLGRNKSGKLLWGYAKLPYVNYRPVMLSASAAYTKDGKEMVDVQNFGLSSSPSQDFKVKNAKGVEKTILVPELKPYEEVTIALP